MSNPFSDIESAFRPMYLDTLSAVCKRNNIEVVGQISCCLFPIDDVDPFDDTESKSDIKKMNVLVQIDDWKRSTISSITPDIGDKFIINGEDWKVSKVENENGQWRIESRNI